MPNVPKTTKIEPDLQTIHAEFNAICDRLFALQSNDRYVLIDMIQRLWSMAKSKEWKPSK